MYIYTYHIQGGRVISHHSAKGTSCVAAPQKTLGTSRRTSHITSIVFCNDSLRAPYDQP